MDTFSRPPHATHHCRHYSYDVVGVGPVCAIGIDMSPPGSSKTCMPNPPIAGQVCILREEFTADERTAWETWRNERAGRMILVLAQIPGSSRDRKNRPEWGKSGKFPCPACDGGTVRWARAAINGHVHAGCTTPNCFEIIE